MYDDSELLERYIYNRNTIVCITDIFHKDLCPLTGRSQSIDAIAKVVLTLCPSSVIIQSKEKNPLCNKYVRLQIIIYFLVYLFIQLVFNSLSFLKNNITGYLHTANTSLTSTYLSFLYNLITFNLSCLINTNLIVTLS